MWLEKMRQSFPSFYSTSCVNKEVSEVTWWPVKPGRCGDPEGGTLVLMAVQSSGLSGPLTQPALNCDAPCRVSILCGRGGGSVSLKPCKSLYNIAYFRSLPAPKTYGSMKDDSWKDGCYWPAKRRRQKSTASQTPLHQANQLLYADCSHETLGICKVPALSVLISTNWQRWPSSTLMTFNIRCVW